MLLAELDEQFHIELVAAAGNSEMTRIHTELTEKIRIVRRVDFLKTDRVLATYQEHGKILEMIARRRFMDAQTLLSAHITQSRLEVRKITIWMMAEARQAQLEEKGTRVSAKKLDISCSAVIQIDPLLHQTQPHSRAAISIKFHQISSYRST